jgi:ABC-type glycerol-3-phosphate transport system permease component
LKSRVLNVVIFVVALVILLIFLFPFLWLLLTSFKNKIDATALPPIWDFSPTLDNYIHVLKDKDFPRMLLNSLFIGVVSTFIGIITGTMAGYALARFKFRGRNFIGSWTLSTLMVPPAVSLIPIFVLAGQLNLTDNYLALIIPYVAFNLPLIILMIRGFILDIPIEIEESALIDGCSTFMTLRKIVLPLIAPGIVAASILTFIACWNEFLFALVLSRDTIATAPIGIAKFMTMYGVQWGDMTASAIIITLPIIIFTIVVRKHLVRGLTFGAVKG